MQPHPGLQLLTTAEAAHYLRLKERKLYELVAEGGIPCTKVTGKWLFPRGDLDRWLLAGLARPLGVIPAEPPPIIGGSHDPLLQWALAECRAGLAILPEGSKRGYRRFLAGEVLAAAIHFHDADGAVEDANVAVVTREAGLYDAVLIAFAKREQGLVVATGNPLGLAGLADVHKRRARLVVRPEGASAQHMLRIVTQREGVAAGALKPVMIAQTGPDVAQAIRADHADCGVATRAVADAAGLSFLPLMTERFDILMRQRDSYRPPLRALMQLMRSDQFAERAAEMGGLDVSEAGAVRWAP